MTSGEYDLIDGDALLEQKMWARSPPTFREEIAEQNGAPVNQNDPPMTATRPLSPLREVGLRGGKILGRSGRIFQVVSIFYILSQSGTSIASFQSSLHLFFSVPSSLLQTWIIISMSQLFSPAKIELKDMNTPSKVMETIEAVFYQYLMHKMITPQFNKELTLYYSRFLKNEFTEFNVGRGYPFINKECQSAQCYFYIRFDKEQDFSHPFLKLLIDGVTYSCPNCKIKFSADVDKFVYDAGLAGLLQHKLKNDELRYISMVEITKNNDIHLRKKGEIYQKMNRIRLEEITRVAPGLTEMPDNYEHLKQSSKLKLIKKESDISETNESLRQEENKQQITNQPTFFIATREKGLTMKINTEKILNKIRNQILSSPSFMGSKFSTNEDELKSLNPRNIVLPILNIDKKNGNIILYQQDSHSTSFLPAISICKSDKSPAIQVEKNMENKNVHYYDSETMTIYVLYSSKQVYFCDLRYMYNMVKGCFNLQFLCYLTQMEEIKPETTRIIVRQNIMYVFIGKSKTFINVYKVKLPQKLQDAVDVKAEMILENKFRNRLGFNLSFVPAKHLMNDQCILLFGGVIEKMPAFKLLEVMLLPYNAAEKYFYHKISLVSHDNECLNQRNPSFAVYRQNLVVWGGTLSTPNHQTSYSRHLAIVPLKEQAVNIALQELYAVNQKDNLADVSSFGSVHVSSRTSKDDSGWLVMMKGLHKLGKVNVIRIREQNGVFMVENLRNSKDI